MALARYRRRDFFSVVQSGTLTRDSGGGILLAQTPPTQTPEDTLLRTDFTCNVGVELRQPLATETGGWWAQWTSWIIAVYDGQGALSTIPWSARNDLDVVATGQLTATAWAVPNGAGHGGSVHLSTISREESHAQRKPLGLISDAPHVLLGWDATNFAGAFWGGDPNVNLYISGSFTTWWGRHS